MRPLNIESQREELEYVGWRKMALELRKKLPHLRGRKRSKLLLQPSAVTGVRTNRLTYRRLYAAIAAISLAMNVWVMSVTLPGYKAKVAKVDAMQAEVKKANRTIVDISKMNTLLKTKFEKETDKAIAELKSAAKYHEKMANDYQKLIEKLFSQATK